MRRSTARGRVFPQSFSTDRRYGRLSLKAIALFPLMWANGDDQGRLSGDPEEIKYAVCPNVDHITKKDIPELLKELEDNKLILCYDTPKSAAIQILDWWYAHQRLQWAWPSEYQPPGGWQDHLRYKRDAHTVETLNWPVSGERSGEDNKVSQVSEGLSSGERSGETSENSPLTTPYPEKETVNEEETETVRGRGNSPEGSGEETSPSLVRLSILEQNNFNLMLDCFRNSWAKVPAGKPWQTIPREPKPRELAQLRDLSKQISAAGGCPPSYISDAFNEAAGHSKMTISYVRAIILDWMGVARNRSP